jgi:hypothetical protein
MMTTILTVSIVLPFVAAIFLPVQQTNTKQCNSDNNNDKNYSTHSTSCTYDQRKNDNHDGSSATTEDKIPFILAFPEYLRFFLLYEIDA